jgi:hypothetical protein
MAHRDVVAILGPVDECLIADIVATGASAQELGQAFAWVNSDEALIGEGRHLPDGKVAELIELLSPTEDDR